MRAPVIENVHYAIFGYWTPRAARLPHGDGRRWDECLMKPVEIDRPSWKLVLLQATSERNSPAVCGAPRKDGLHRAAPPRADRDDPVVANAYEHAAPLLENLERAS